VESYDVFDSIIPSKGLKRNSMKSNYGQRPPSG
jgi:hypothetical protein